MKKYKPSFNKSESWVEIEKWYLELIECGLKFEPMLNLIKHIQKTNLDSRLFAYASI